MRRVEPDTEAARRAELANFLRARRESLQPAQVGLCPQPGRRNTPGLRREEVAQISGVGLTWYTWLEQARPITISSHVVDALGHAFRLDYHTHAHLRRLAGLPVPEPDQMPDAADIELTHLLDTMMPAPACIFGPCFDFIAWNDTFGQLWHPEALPSHRRNLLWLAFCDPAFRHTMVGWQERAQTLLREFRAAHGRYAGDGRFAELVAALQENSEEFRQWWPSFDVVGSITGRIIVRHPEGRTLELHVNELRLCAYPSLTLSVQVPRRAEDRARLDKLITRSPSAAPRAKQGGAVRRAARDVSRRSA